MTQTKRKSVTALGCILLAAFALLASLPARAWTVYFDNSVKQWENVYIWAWCSEGGCETSYNNTQFPGPSMTRMGTSNIYYYTGSCHTPSEFIISTNIDGNEVKIGGGNLTYVDGAVFKSDATYVTYTNDYVEEVSASSGGGETSGVTAGIAGGMNGWSTSANVTTADASNLVTFVFGPWENDWQFKPIIVEGNSTAYYGNGQVLQNGVGVTVTTEGDTNSNLTLESSATGKSVTLTFDVVTHVVTATWEMPVIEPTGTLPVLYINIYQTDAAGNFILDAEGQKVFDQEVISKDLADKDYRSGEYWLDMSSCTWMGDDAKSVGSAEAPLALEMKARGNYTRTGFSKKPFKLKLGKKQNLLGLTPAKSKHWAILAHADDNYGYMRNFTGFNLGKRMGLPWTPGQQPVEVVINGDYRGLYFLTESIRVGDGRVPVTELDDLATDQDLISGGYLVELDNYDDDNQIRMDELTCAGNSPDKLRVTFDTPEVYSDIQRKFVTDQFTAMNKYVGDNSDDLWKYMDLDDAARYYVIEEIVSHTESYHGSTYLYRDRGVGQKWHFSPLWDFGNAFNGPTENWFYTAAPFGTTWLPSMRCNTTFMAKVKESWKWFMNKCYDGIMADLEAYADHISAAAVRDHERWGSAALPTNTGSNNPTAVYDNSDMASRLTAVRNHLNSKISWLEEQWGSYTGDISEPERDTTPAAELPDYATPYELNAEAGQSNTLPVVVVTLPNGAELADITLGTALEGATVRVLPANSGAAKMAAATAQIKGRGDDWTDGGKNSYKLKFSSKQTPLGMNESKHFVLEGYSADAPNAYLTNYAGHCLAQAAGMDWTPAMQPVELVVNHEYRGLYWLVENVRSAETRVNITETKPAAFTAESDWLVQLDNYDDDAHFTLNPEGCNAFSVKSDYPDFEDFATDPSLTSTVTYHLATAVTALHEAAQGAASNIFDQEWMTLIDIDQATRFYIVQEIMDCGDGLTSDFFMSRRNGRWSFGPVWNFSDAFASTGAKSELLANRPLLDHLYANRYFRKQLVTNFQQLVYGITPADPDAKDADPSALRGRVAASGQYSDTFQGVLDDITAMAGTIQEGVDADAAKWLSAASAIAVARSSASDSATQAANAINSGINLNVAYLTTPVASSGAGWDVLTTTALPVVEAAEGSDEMPVWFDLAGRRIAKPVAGSLYIVRRGQHVAKEIAR